MDIGYKRTDKMLSSLEKRIRAEYKQAEKEVKEKLDKYLARFDVKDEKHRNDLKQIENQYKKGKIPFSEYKEAKEGYKKWRESQIMVGQRWENLRDTLAQDYNRYNNIAKNTVNSYMPDVYALNHNFGTYEVEKAGKIDTSYVLYNHDAVEHILRQNPELLPPPAPKSVTSKRIADGIDVRWNKQQIQSVMMQGILQGESIPRLAKRLAKTVGDKNMVGAVRNARTMTTRAQNYGRLDAYKRASLMGIRLQKQWVATLDHRTRDSHVDLDGEIVDINATFSNGMDCPGGMGPPEEVYNCRCTMVSAFKGFDDNIGQGVRSEEKLGGMSYDEWKQYHRNKLEKKKVKPVATVPKAKPAPKPVVSTTEQNMINAVQNFQKIKNPKEDDIKAVGRAVRERMDEVYGGFDKYLSLKKEYNESVLHDKDDSRSSKIAKELKALQDNLKGQKSSETLKKELGKIRPMGIPQGIDIKAHLNNSKSSVRKSVEKAYNLYPSEWVQNSVARGNMKPLKAKRGSYSHWAKEIRISGYSEESQVRCSLHELAHRFERTQDLVKYEKTFYERRTKGEPLKWLGAGYKKEEKARKDDFIDAYMGKDYGGYSYELASMGMPYAYLDPVTLYKDKDMMDFIYGLLAVR